MSDTPHAICCWCQRALVKSAGTGTWWCPTDACQQRQLAWSVRVEDRKKKQTSAYLFVPLPKQVEFLSRTSRYVLFGGAAGPGKSHAGRWGLYRACLEVKGLECLLVRNTFKQLEKTHLRRIEAEARRFTELGVPCEYLSSKYEVRFPAQESLIQAGHMEDAAAVEDYLSTEYDIIMEDEAAQLPVDPDGHAVALSLATRARTTKPQVLQSWIGRGKCWTVTNPGGPSWGALLDFYIDKTPDFDKYPQLAPGQPDAYAANEWDFVPALLDDNPYLPPAYARDLGLLPKWRYEQLRHGNLRVFAGQFFSEFNERVHVRTLAA